MPKIYGLIFCLMVLMVPGALFAQDKSSSGMHGADDKNSAEVVQKNSVSKNARESKTTKKNSGSSSSTQKKTSSSSKKTST